MKAFVIAGTQSGSGKTSVALGLCAALLAKGLRVQSFKCGPDYLDPTHLALATGRPCYNLDLWLGGEDYIRELFVEACSGAGGREPADIAVVEGVMGIYDGVNPDSSSGSTADIARILGLPVFLLASCASCARTFAAVVQGITAFAEAPEFMAVAANMAGSASHVEIIRKAVSSVEGLPDFAGGILRGAFSELSSRHLGLVSAENSAQAREHIASLASAVEKSLDLDLLLAKAEDISLPEKKLSSEVNNPETTKPLRLAIARDEAFSFYYPDNLDALRESGVELVEFSPLSDSGLPDRCAGVYLGGGYPECHAQQLEKNLVMRESLAAFARSGGLVYAECGGLMYLCRSILTHENCAHQMCGIFDVDVTMLQKLRTLGYMEAEVLADCCWGGAGQKLRGHEYHYSQIASEISAQWQQLYTLRRGRKQSDQPRSEGYAWKNVLLSYLHLHFASNPSALASFVQKLAAATVLS